MPAPRKPPRIARSTCRGQQTISSSTMAIGQILMNTGTANSSRPSTIAAERWPPARRRSGRAKSRCSGPTRCPRPSRPAQASRTAPSRRGGHSPGSTSRTNTCNAQTSRPMLDNVQSNRANAIGQQAERREGHGERGRIAIAVDVLGVFSNQRTAACRPTNAASRRQTRG